jgi:hypothetical protein
MFVYKEETYPYKNYNFFLKKWWKKIRMDLFVLQNPVYVVLF